MDSQSNVRYFVLQKRGINQLLMVNIYSVNNCFLSRAFYFLSVSIFSLLPCTYFHCCPALFFHVTRPIFHNKILCGSLQKYVSITLKINMPQFLTSVFDKLKPWSNANSTHIYVSVLWKGFKYIRVNCYGHWNFRVF